MVIKAIKDWTTKRQVTVSSRCSGAAVFHILSTMPLIVPLWPSLKAIAIDTRQFIPTFPRESQRWKSNFDLESLKSFCGGLIVKDDDFIGAFFATDGRFWTVSTRAPGIISVLIKKEKGKKYCSWPEAVRFMEWKSISVGRLCMPLRFTSTGWIPVMAAGTGAKIRPKHLIFYLSVNALKYSSLPIVRCSCLITLPRFTDWSRPWRLSDNKS